MAEPMVGALASSSNRKVWVVNHNHEPYTEEFRGENITVPANAKKELLMPYLAARRFLAEPKAPGEKLPNGTYRSQPKALETIELTDEERMKYEGLSTSEMAGIAKAEDKAAAQSHSAEMKKTGGFRKILLGDE